MPLRSWEMLGRAALGFARDLHSRSRLGDMPTVDLRQAIVDEANAQGVPPPIALAVATRESGIMQWYANGKLVIGDNGKSIGIFQIQQASAPGYDLTDPLQNIEAGVKFLAKMNSKYGDWWTALAAYNWGPGNVDKAIARGLPPSSWPSAGYATQLLGAAGVGSVVSSSTSSPDFSQPAASQTSAPPAGDFNQAAMPAVNQTFNLPLVLIAMGAAMLGVEWLLDG